MKTTSMLRLCLLVLLIFPVSLKSNETLLWSFETDDRVVAEPVIRNDSLFMGSLDGNFYVLDALTGTEIWHYTTGNQIRTTAALWKDIVCFESGNVLYGLGMDGSLLWTDTLYDGGLLNEHDTWDVFRSSPTLYDSIAYIGSEEGQVLGVNVKTGQRVFRVQTPQADATIETTPAVYNDKVYVGDWLGVLSVFDLSTEELVWQYDTKEDNTYAWVNAIVSKPLIYRDTLYFGGRNCNLYAFDPETGERIWMYHQPDDKWLFGGPVVENDTLYVGSSFQQQVYAFNPDEPELYWEAGVYGLNYGDPEIASDYVLVGTGSTGGNSSGSLSLVNKTNHELTGRFNIDGWVETPLYLEGNVYFGCGNGYIYAVDMEALLNVVWPETVLKDESDIDLGTLAAEGTVSTSFYLYNTGEGADSISDISNAPRLDVQPSSFLLAPEDSLEVNVTIDLEGLSAGNKSYTVLLNSDRSIIPTSFSRRIVLTIEETDALSGKVKGNPFSLNLYPNPATDEAKIEFYLDRPSYVQAILYNILGSKICTLFAGKRPTGDNCLSLDISFLERGQYICFFQSNDQVISRKLLILN